MGNSIMKPFEPILKPFNDSKNFSNNSSKNISGSMSTIIIIAVVVFVLMLLGYIIFKMRR